MKVIVTYPQITINTVEIEFSDSEIEGKDLEDLYTQVDLVNTKVPSYDELDYNMCKGAREVDSYKFKIVE